MNNTLLNSPFVRALRPIQKWLGVPLALVLLGIVGMQLYAYRQALLPTLREVDLRLALAALAVICLGNILLGWNWVWILRVMGFKGWRLEAMAAFFLANLARYLPGGVWHFPGRVLWLHRQGFGGRAAVAALVIDQAVVLATAGLVGLLLGNVVSRYMALGAALAGLGALLVGHRLLAHRLKIGALERPMWGSWLALSGSYGLFWLLNGLGVAALAASLLGWGRLSIAEALQIAGRSTLAWALGFVAFFAPGGWGVRELAFIQLLSAILPEQPLVPLLAILSRGAQIAAELLTGALFLAARLPHRPEAPE